MCSRNLSLSLLASVLASSAGFAAPPQLNTPNWLLQFGTPTFDVASGIIAVSGGGFIVSGATAGILANASAGGDDIFLARYASNGERLWLRQYGSSDLDYATSIAPDSAGGVLVAGNTRGSFGGPLIGYHDAFLARFNANGDTLWTRQFGTNKWDVAHAVAPDGSGGALVAGVTDGDLAGASAGRIDAFLARFSETGEELWITQFGTAGIDTALAVASDEVGGAIVAGVTTGDLGGLAAGAHDVFVARMNSAGEQVWVRQFGTDASDTVTGLAPDGNGGVIVVGLTHGSLGAQSAGRSDAYAAHYDRDGNLLWLRQFGSDGSDAATAVVPDGNGGVLITGYTYTDLGGPYAGGGDTFLAHFDADGQQLSMRQFGSPDRDEPRALADDGQGSVAIVGFTTGTLGSVNAGGVDIFIAHFESTPCYADCDRSTGEGTLDVFDFLCFQDSFIGSESYACDCDSTTDQRVCDIFDFLCFQQSFVRGCTG